MPRPPRQRNRRPRPDLGSRGYLYLLQFSNGVIKAGKTTDVAAREADHEKEAARYDISVVNRWSSSLYDDAAVLERRLVTVLARIGRNTKAGKEYFSGISFAVARHRRPTSTGSRVNAVAAANASNPLASHALKHS